MKKFKWIMAALLLVAMAIPAYAQAADLVVTLTPATWSGRWGTGLPLVLTMKHAQTVPVTATVTDSVEFTNVDSLATFTVDVSMIYTVSRPVGLKRVKIPGFALIRTGTLKLDAVAITLDASGYYTFPTGTELSEGQQKVITYTIL